MEFKRWELFHQKHLIFSEPEAWFSIVQAGELWILVSRSPVPEEVLKSNNQLLFTIVANKPNTTSGLAVISLDLPKGKM